MWWKHKKAVNTNNEYPKAMYTFRVSWTGITLYHLYFNDELLCTASTYPLPGPIVSFCDRDGKSWHCEYPRSGANIDQDTVTIVDSKSKQTDMKITQLEQDLYFIKKRYNSLLFEEELLVRKEEGNYVFYREEQPVARLSFILTMPRGYRYPSDLPKEAEPRFCIYLNKEISCEMLALINAFPLVIL